MKTVDLPTSLYAGYFNSDIFDWLRDNKVDYDFVYDRSVRTKLVALLFEDDEDALAFSIKFSV